MGEIQGGNTGMARSQMRFPNLGRGAPLSARQGTSQDPSLSATRAFGNGEYGFEMKKYSKMT